MGFPTESLSFLSQDRFPGALLTYRSRWWRPRQRGKDVAKKKTGLPQNCE